MNHVGDSRNDDTRTEPSPYITKGMGDRGGGVGKYDLISNLEPPIPYTELVVIGGRSKNSCCLKSYLNFFRLGHSSF